MIVKKDFTNVFRSKEDDARVSIIYKTLNESRIIDPATFVTHWEVPPPIEKVQVKNDSEWEVIRVKQVIEPDNKEPRLSRPRRLWMVTTGDHTVYYKYDGIKKGNLIPVVEENIVKTWNKGLTPRPKPLRKYTKDQLRAWGYSEEQIEKAYRGFSSKDINLVSKKLSTPKDPVKFAQARLLLEKYGSCHKVYMEKKEIIAKKKADREEYLKHATPMGAFTHKKRQCKAKVGSRRYRKLVAKQLYKPKAKNGEIIWKN
jgi:hypothetical protein